MDGVNRVRQRLMNETQENQCLMDTRVKQMAKFWTQVQPHVAAFVSSMVSDFHDAEDIVQRVAMAVADGYDDLDRVHSPVAWAIAIARNQVYNHYRTQRRRHMLFDSDVLDRIEDAHVKVASELIDQREVLAQCVKKLNPRQYHLLELRYVAGMKPDVMATKLRSSVNAVNVALHRLRQTLARCVQDQTRDKQSNGGQHFA